MPLFDSINVEYIDSPFYIEDMPLGNTVYVIDDYLESSLHKSMNRHLDHCSWQKTNEVQSQTPNRGGLPNHSLWGCSFFRNPDICLLYTSPSPRDQRGSRMPSSA